MKGAHVKTCDEALHDLFRHEFKGAELLKPGLIDLVCQCFLFTITELGFPASGQWLYVLLDQ